MTIDPMTRLITALADVLVEDYLRERASNDEAGGLDAENPAYPTLPRAA